MIGIHPAHAPFGLLLTYVPKYTRATRALIVGVLIALIVGVTLALG